MQTFPVPGGPNSNIPFQGDNRPVKYLRLKCKLECKCFTSTSGYELTWIVELYQLSLINRQRKMYPIGHHMTEKSWHTKEFLKTTAYKISDINVGLFKHLL